MFLSVPFVSSEEVDELGFTTGQKIPDLEHAFSSLEAHQSTFLINTLFLFLLFLLPIVSLPIGRLLWWGK
jgi:hypothetical protein